MTPQDVLKFWFEELTPKEWFAKDSALDANIQNRFSALHAWAVSGELYAWRNTPEGRLAEIIVLDQFSRNMFRDSPWAFASDGMALVLAQEAVRVHADDKLPILQKAFLYMPYMHSESRSIHNLAVQLFSVPGLESNLNFEMKHKAIIDRFGRFPHRNDVLGRISTAEEVEFLKQPGSGF